MSDFQDQVPYSNVFEEVNDFAANPEPRCPCILLLDRSGSMQGNPIDELNSGLRLLQNELREDQHASKRIEVAVVTFGPVETQTHFHTVDQFEAPRLTPGGDTPMGAAIELALQMLN